MKKLVLGILSVWFLSGCGGYVVFKRPDIKPEFKSLMNQTVVYRDENKQLISGVVTDEFMLYSVYPDLGENPRHFIIVNGMGRDANYVYFKKPLD